MAMATCEILSSSISHKPGLNFVMESIHQILPIFEDTKYQKIINSDQGYHH